MLEEIYFRDKSLTEDDYYDALLFVLGDAYPDLSEEEIEDLLEESLDRMPEQYADSVLDTIGNVGKKIGTGTLKFAADNPDLIKAAATVGGAAIGGPMGAQIGGSAANYLAQSNGQKRFLPQTGKTLALMQNPQAQAAIARATLGVGNGTAPLMQNGNINLIPIATFLRAVIAAAQGALRELDNQNIVPAASFSEAMPYADDVDMQAEWLAEQLVQ